MDIEKIESFIKSSMEYYKWIVSIIVIFLGFSLSLVPSLEALQYKSLLLTCWISLSIAITCNIFLIKSFQTYLTIITFDNQNKLSKLIQSGIELRWKILGNIQNFGFLVGMLTVLLFMIFNLFGNT